MADHKMTYSLRNVPADLWLAARRRALDDHLTLRQVLITLLQYYVDCGIPQKESDADGSNTSNTVRNHH